MTAPYGAIVERARRRAAGEDPDAQPGRYTDIVERARQRRAAQDAAAQEQGIARARTLTKPPVATPMDRPVDVGTPGPVNGFRGSGGGVSWDDGEGFTSNLVTQAVDAAGRGSVQSAGGALQTVADVLPAFARPVSTGLRTVGRELEDWAGANRAALPRVQSIGEALDSPANFRDYAGAVIGQGLGSSVPTLAGAVVGGLPGAFAASYAQQVGEVGREFDEVAPGMDRGERARKTLGLAVPLAGLDMVTELGATRGATRALLGETAELWGERTAREVAGNVARATAKGAASEGLTEALQEGGSYFGTRGLAGAPMSLAEGLSRMGEAGVAGALPGGVMGGSSRSVQELAGWRQRQDIGEGQWERAPGIIPKALRGTVEPDFEVFDEPEAQAAQAAEAREPRPGAVPMTSPKRPVPAEAPVTPAPTLGGVPVVEPVAEPVVEPMAAPAAETVAEPVAPPAMPPASIPAPEPVVEPAAEPVAAAPVSGFSAVSAPTENPDTAVSPPTRAPAPVALAPRAALADELATEPEPEALPVAEAAPAPGPAPAPSVRPEQATGRPMRTSARTNAGRLVNDLTTVSDAGLIDELETLTTRLQRDQGQSAYDYVENQFSVDAGAKLAVATRDGKGPSMQAKAQRRVQLTQGVVDRVIAELERRGVDPAAELVRRAEAANAPLAEGATDFDPSSFEDEAFPTSVPASAQPARTAQMERAAASPAPVPAPTAGPSLSQATDREVRDRLSALRGKRRAEGLTESEQQEAAALRGESLRRFEVQRGSWKAADAARKQAEEEAGQQAVRAIARDRLYLGALPDANRAIYSGDSAGIATAVDELVRAQRDMTTRYGDRFQNTRVREILQEYRPEAVAELTRLAEANATATQLPAPPGAAAGGSSATAAPAADPVAAALSTLNETLTALRQDLTQARDGGTAAPSATPRPERTRAEGSGIPTPAEAADGAPAAEAGTEAEADADDGVYLPDTELVEVDDEVGAEPRYAYTDPMAAAIGEAARRIKATLDQRQQDTAPLFESQFPEVEARLRQGEQGLPTLTIRQRVQQALAGLTAGLRHFPELDATRDHEHALINEALLTAERSGAVSQAKAADSILQIVQGLSPSEVQLMSRKLALDDIVKDIDNGLYDRGNPVPFYGRDADGKTLPVGEARARVLQDQQKVTRVLQANAKVAAAIERRQTFAKALTTQLVQIGNLDASVLDDPRYYHRQVLAAAEKRLLVQQGQWTGVGAPRDARVKSRGFMKQRTGGGDFNLAYIEAEYEWVAQGYQNLLLHEVLETVKAFDRTPELKADAHRWNIDRFYEMVEEGDDDPLAQYAQRIAAGRQRITRELQADRVTVAPRFLPMVRALLEAEANGERFAHPLWFPFLSEIVQQDNAAGKAAAGIYKAMAARKQHIKDALGDQYVNPADPEALLAMAGDEFGLWQPEKGNVFYSALTVTEKELAQLVSGGAVDVEQLKRLMVMGGKKPAYILPAGIVKTLDNLKPAQSPTNILDGALKAEVRAWKVWTLLNPTRVIKYNLNNVSSDIEVAIMLPGVGPQIAQAAKDLWRYQRTRDLSGPATAELQDLIERGVIGQTQTTAEIPDIKTFEEFRHLATMPPNAFMAAVAVYWDHARGLTTWRENVLRLAAYRYFLGQLNAGKRVYGASNRTRVDALQSNEEKAALLSRDMLGDYGNISSLGQTVRDRFLPFYSWMEVNAKRFVNLARNARYEEGGAVGGVENVAKAAAVRLGLGGVSMTAMAAARLGTAVGLASLFMAAVAAYNATVWGDEWDELRKTGRDGHLILWKTEDGDIVTVRVEGAFADFLSWVGMKDLPQDVRELLNDKVGYGDLIGDAIMAPVKKVAGSLEPMTQALYSFLTGKSLFPDPLNPRTLKDPMGRAYGALFDAWSLGLVYRNVMLPLGGVPADPRPAKSELVNLIAYRTDGGQLAYDAARSMTFDWLEKEGRDRPGGANTKKSAALHYYRKALQYGEDEAARAWFQRYVALGGTREAAKQSLKRAGPLSAIPLAERNRFLATLGPQERDVVKRAHQFYFRQMVGPSERTMTRPEPKAASKDPVPFSLAWYLEQAGAGR